MFDEFCEFVDFHDLASIKSCLIPKVLDCSF